MSADLRARLRSLIWAAPVLAAAQPACTQSASSCDDFRSERREVRAPPPLLEDGGSNTSALASDEGCRQFCEQHTFGTNYACRSEAAGDGGTELVCAFNTVCEGRRPMGFAPPATDRGAPAMGRYFAAVAAAEAASVIAFERLADELDAHALPSSLAQRARRAAAQEQRHWRMTAALARRFGAHAEPGSVGPALPRSLLELALENAREGVVREAFGAAAGLWQAQHAAERSVRAVMRRIAEDELAHAELSFDVDSALRERLSADEREQLERATSDELAQMSNQLGAEVDPELEERAGLPSRAVMRAMFAVAARTVWGQG